MENKKNEITEIISTEIVEEGNSIFIELNEIGIDTLMDESILKDIPLVKSLVGFYNIYNSVRDRHNVIKILTFFSEFRKEKINENDYIKFKERFEKNITYREKVIETIALYNERFIDKEKSVILARLIRSHIQGKLSWEDLSDVIVVLDSMHPKGFVFLEKMAQSAHWANSKRDIEGEPLMFSSGIGHRIGSLFSITQIGQNLYNYGMKSLE